MDRKGVIRVDGHSKTSVDNIYAIGDCTDRLEPDPVAIKEAMAFADTCFGGKTWAMDHSNVAPACASASPQVADRRHE
jgi:glutathione reductase (NADPH)